MSATINVDVKATDKGMHVLIWDDDDEGDTQCINDLCIPWNRIATARANSRKGTFTLGNFDITARPKIVDKWGKQVVDFEIEETGNEG